ncbi:transcriptional regulator, TetR family protein [Streptomyces bingchenggensis BCW-1]|uniref:Transcriptional regulator, TetR family protein n=1 Tax=Streptomyces bingchenggensis (strain BCW-1) TaxID=749414 RepID=D7C6A7_STRBB|nr:MULTISPECIES: TetR/AcrR family transcriptional regulator [Streptomyces]ADI04095.1 transcriptional regulator, TetR family protein [Streptomyces bingchenggensis BCW-1]
MPRQAPLRQGSPEKRAAIVAAALRIFVSEGYARASMDAIAADAKVSKRTIYDYFGDKERLFLAVIEETEAAQEEGFHALLERTLDGVTATSTVATAPGTGGPGPGAAELEAALIVFGREFATAVLRSPVRAALVRLISAEAGHFPALRRRAGSVGHAQQAITERLERYAEAGLLDIADPVEAAEYFGLLVTGRVNNRSLFGTVEVDDALIDELVAGGVRFFLRAYAPGPRP